jgi:large subunit ribosomal protein L24|tara:strand:+ start:188 stop:448 length:261 start_codon:yes stop_codon:yes gene_type:complete
MNLKKGNLVKVLTGKDKNKSGEIIEIIHSLNKAKVKGINMVKKHLKTTKEKKGGIISKENFIHLSNLMIAENKKGKTITKNKIIKK